MPESGAATAPDPLLENVLRVVRELARETGGHRAAAAVSAHASLEREVGLGSLERVELLTRLESAFGRSLDEGVLALDSPAALAEALSASPAAAPRARAATDGTLAAARRLEGEPRSVHESLWRRALAEPERPHVYMREDDGREHTIGYGALLDGARAVAGGLRERGVRRGDTLALMLPTGFDFLRCFQGILVAGAIPVPIYPPVRLDRLEEYALRQAAILADAGVKALLTIDRARPVAALLKSRAPSLREIATADELALQGTPWEAPEGGPEDAAFIQYTSGSTGHPKGVLLTHANLLANVRAIARGLEARETDVGAIWLPLYHDMGLIGSWLFCMHQGYPIDIQSPLSFLARPERWLWAIHRRRATLSAAPNFAYEMAARKIPDAALEGLDLSSWRCALNGAEPVNPETLERFARRFAPYGFRREALMPVYGLAENSVALCFPPVGRGPRVDRVRRGSFESGGLAEPAAEDDTSALRFVSVGVAVPEHEVRLVDDNGAPVAERQVGRLLFRGPSMTSGYFRQPEATASMTAADGFLDSGDLAYRADGEIFIAGRRKDLIITGGRNYVPQEIEEAAAQAQGVRKGCVVAFGAPDATSGTELLVVVAETRAQQPAARERIEQEVIERVADAIGVPPDRVVLAPPGAVPKTSSGKVRRNATRALFLSGELGRTTRNSAGTLLRLGISGFAQALRPARSRLARGAYAAWLALALPPPLLVAWALAALLPSRRLAAALERGYLRYALLVAGVRGTLVGAGLPERGPLLLACNHASYADIPALMALLPRPVLFVAKREVLGWPLISTFVRRVGHLAVERFEAQGAVADIERVSAAVASGATLLVFPEGTFAAASGLRPFRLGAFKTAAETGTPVVPLALQGTRRVLRDGSLLPRPARVRLWIGEPIAPRGSAWRDVVELRDRVADAIAAECGEPRLDLVAGGPPRPEGAPGEPPA
jgi:fatty-acyl-CoA synthase